jgi:hypothetical protein
MDGNKDILLAGNLFATEVRTPRNDGSIGLLLQGDGTGQFKSISYTESGFFVPYDVKSLIQVKGKNSELVLAGSNNSSLKIFRINKNGLVRGKE